MYVTLLVNKYYIYESHRGNVFLSYLAGFDPTTHGSSLLGCRQRRYLKTTPPRQGNVNFVRIVCAHVLRRGRQNFEYFLHIIPTFWKLVAQSKLCTYTERW
jgi:hypothetical protein